MNILRKPSHVGVVGKSGTGKTEYGCRYMVGSVHDRVLIFDHMIEFPERLGRLCVATESLEDFIDKVERYRIVSYDPSVEFPGEYEAALTEWANLVFTMAKMVSEYGVETLAVIDELQKLVNPHDVPTDVKALLQTGRKYALDTLLMSQQPNRLPNEVREQWTELISFRLKDPSSLKSLESLGADVEKIAELPDLHYLHTDVKESECTEGVLSF